MKDFMKLPINFDINQKQDEWLSPFEIEWHNKNVRQLKALVNGIKYILENERSNKNSK